MQDIPLIAYSKIQYEMEEEGEIKNVIGRVFVSNSCRGVVMLDEAIKFRDEFGDEEFDPNIIQAYGNYWQKEVNSRNYKLNFNELKSEQKDRNVVNRNLMDQIRNKTNISGKKNSRNIE